MTRCLAVVCVALLGNALSALAQPANDTCANAITLVSGVATQAPINNFATRDGPASISCGVSPPAVFNDIWYRIVPVRGPSGVLAVTSTPFTNQWRFVEVFSAAGGCGALGAPVACDATTTPTNVQFTLPATASGYLVRIGFGSPYIGSRSRSPTPTRRWRPCRRRSPTRAG